MSNKKIHDIIIAENLQVKKMLEHMKDIRVREYKCRKCGLEIERDYNASLNILKEGLRCYNN